MRQFNENWDGIRRTLSEAAKAKEGIEVRSGSLIDTKDGLKIGWYDNDKVAEIARDMVIAWAKKNGVSFTNGSKAVVSQLTTGKDKSYGNEVWKELEAIRRKAFMEYNRKKGFKEETNLAEAEENIYKRAAPAWRRKRSVGGTPEVSLDIQSDIPRLPGATSYLDNDNISIYAWVRPHKFGRGTPMSPGKTYRYEAYVSVSYGNHEEVMWSYHSDDPRRSFQRYAPYEGEAVKMCEDFIERGLRALASVKPELAKFLVNWRKSGPRFQTGTPYLK